MMPMLRCATLTVANVDAAVARYGRWLDYRTIEQGLIEHDLAQGWGTPAALGRPWALCAPASGAPVFLRFVEGDPVPAYRPITSFGWAATELCVTDVGTVHARLADSPFAVIGPPTPIGGLPTIRPMQVRGPDDDTTYLTEILTHDPTEGLPVPKSLVDHLFILVLACRDITANARWFGKTLGLDVSDPVSIRYSMINKAFELPVETQHAIATAKFGGRILLEFDQYPDGATDRPVHPDALPPGVAIGTLWHPDFDRLRVDWITPPARREGALYDGRLSGAIRTPEGGLVELIDGR
jgi:catechol 2,3-dioxygenase-like lactoylglutathione lyase family enzyme